LVKPLCCEATDIFKLPFELRCQRATVTSQQCLSPSRCRSDGFFNCNDCLAGSCAASYKSARDFGDHIQYLVLRWLKYAELGFCVCQSRADAEAKRERLGE